MDNENLTLLILAAGMGSRFGGLKQLAPLGPHDEFIIDYSVYDAKRAGFNKIVFLIKEENYDLFKETIGKRVEKSINVEYAFQKNDDLCVACPNLKQRVKPLGTAHAVLCAKDKINEPFMMINADDFYGFDAFDKAAKFLRKLDINKEPYEYGLVAYIVKNTMSENGSVKRGICKVDNNSYLEEITESIIDRENGKLIAKKLSNEKEFEISEDDTVSMNMLLFSPSIFNFIESKLYKFLDDNKDEIDKKEFLIPDVLFDSIKEGYAKVKVINTTSVWYGVTYKEDSDYVKKSLKKLVEDKVYPENLWK